MISVCTEILVKLGLDCEEKGYELSVSRTPKIEMDLFKRLILQTATSYEISTALLGEEVEEEERRERGGERARARVMYRQAEKDVCA